MKKLAHTQDYRLEGAGITNLEVCDKIIKFTVIEYNFGGSPGPTKMTLRTWLWKYILKRHLTDGYRTKIG